MAAEQVTRYFSMCGTVLESQAGRTLIEKLFDASTEYRDVILQACLKMMEENAFESFKNELGESSNSLVTPCRRVSVDLDKEDLITIANGEPAEKENYMTFDYILPVPPPFPDLVDPHPEFDQPPVTPKTPLQKPQNREKFTFGEPSKPKRQHYSVALKEKQPSSATKKRKTPQATPTKGWYDRLGQRKITASLSSFRIPKKPNLELGDVSVTTSSLRQTRTAENTPKSVPKWNRKPLFENCQTLENALSKKAAEMEKDVPVTEVNSKDMVWD